MSIGKIGKSISKGAKSIGKGLEKGTKSVGKGLEKGVSEVGKAGKEVAKNLPLKEIGTAVGAVAGGPLGAAAGGAIGGGAEVAVNGGKGEDVLKGAASGGISSGVGTATGNPMLGDISGMAADGIMNDNPEGAFEGISSSLIGNYLGV